MTPPSYIAWHGASLADHKAKRDRAIKSGHRFASLSIYGDPSEPVYAAVMIKRSPAPDQHDFPSIPAGQFQARFDDETGKGRGPVIISATGSGGDARFAAVFEPQKPIALTRTGLDVKGLGDMNRRAKADGLILHWAALYGDEDDPRYAAVWLPNHAKVTWNADGVQDTSAEYQHRFDAQKSGWARPSFITPGDGGRHHGRSLVADQPHDEARYRLSLVDGDDSTKGLDIAVGQSVMTAGRPMVPLDYGTTHLERVEGSGGLSAAVPDLARLVAVWIGARKDTALKRSTVTMMLDEGIKSSQKHHGEDDDRPGYGLDGAVKLADGSYYGQKGGSLATSGAGIQFNGDWGFCVCWAGKSTVQVDGSGWYPDFSPVMSIATAKDWGTTDLFAHYGLK